MEVSVEQSLSLTQFDSITLPLLDLLENPFLYHQGMQFYELIEAKTFVEQAIEKMYVLVIHGCYYQRNEPLN